MPLMKATRRLAVGLLALALSTCTLAKLPEPGGGAASAPLPPPPMPDHRQEPKPKPDQVEALHQTIKDLGKALGKMASLMEKSPAFLQRDANAVRAYRRLLELMANLQRDLDRSEHAKTVQLSRDTLKSMSALSLDVSRLMLDQAKGLKSVIKPVTDRFDALSDLDDGIQSYLSGKHDGAMIEKLARRSWSGMRTAPGRLSDETLDARVSALRLPDSISVPSHVCHMPRYKLHVDP